MVQTQIALEGFRAAIFDMDGTMIDNMGFHKDAWIEYLKRHGLVLDKREFQQKISGKKNDQIFTELFGGHMSDAAIATEAGEKEAIYRELYAKHIVEVAGLSSTIARLHKNSIRTAIATTANKANRDFGLTALGLSNAFECIVGEEHVTKGKPDPEIYISVARLLNVAPSACLVFEDTPVGVEAAKRAGMTVVGVMTSHDATELSDADYLIQDFNQIEFL